MTNDPAVAGTSEPPESSHDAFHDIAGDAGEPDVEALEFGVEAFVVDAQQREHGRVEVVDADDALDGAVPELIRGAEGGAALHAAAGEEDAEAEDVMVAA